MIAWRTSEWKASRNAEYFERNEPTKKQGHEQEYLRCHCCCYGQRNLSCIEKQWNRKREWLVHIPVGFFINHSVVSSQPCRSFYFYWATNLTVFDRKLPYNYCAFFWFVRISDTALCVLEQFIQVRYYGVANDKSLLWKENSNYCTVVQAMVCLAPVCRSRLTDDDRRNNQQQQGTNEAEINHHHHKKLHTSSFTLGTKILVHCRGARFTTSWNPLEKAKRMEQ